MAKGKAFARDEALIVVIADKSMQVPEKLGSGRCPGG